MILGDRLKERMAECGLSQQALADRVGVKQPTINRLINGGQAGSKHLHRIAAALRTSPGYLLGETDDPSPTAAAQERSLPNTSTSQDDRILEIPVLDLAYGMGGTYLEDIDPAASLEPFPLSFIRRYTKARAEDLVIAEGVGDSMAPTIGSSDQLLIDRSVNTLRIADKVWAFSFGGLGMVKRLRARGDGSIAILSDNPLVPEDRAVDDELFIIGQVVGVMKKL
ncbi:S24 family peptidase [Citromicrobium bathyomarinum]